MTVRLILVRHGQASAFTGDYDHLSELGREQSRRVGPSLARWAREPSHVLVGPRRRHRHTYEEALRTAQADGASWPDPEPTEALDEHHGIQLVHHLGAELGAREDEIGELARAAFSAVSAGAPSDPTKHWMRMFRVLMLAWSRGEVNHDEVEPWIDFRARVRGVLEAAAERSGTVLAFTSGGAIGACVGSVLGLDEARTLDLCWAVRNASLTEIHIGTRGPTLMGFNAIGHLDRDDLITSV
ncbi:MAG: histidine phosphatase family protein [Myxococcota bacterium]|nr:histidine phosphatase family protein [Myxococcota bacterium]